MNSTLRFLKNQLWLRFGTKENPAEWDGLVYGGGKLSQRFWEYFQGLELLDPTPDLIVLDIGGGSPATGAGFFASLLSCAVKKVFVLDPNVSPNAIPANNVEFLRLNGSYESMKKVLQERPDITHISSISVFEHIQPAVREGITRAINDYFQGESFVATFEYHPTHTFFDHQLTAKTVSQLFSPLERYYLDQYVASPVWCENALDQAKLLRLPKGGPPSFAPANIPLWYPVATRFLKSQQRSR